MDWDIESEFVKFGDVHAVHPWRRLTDKLCTELPRDVFRELIYLSKDVLGCNDYNLVLKDIEKDGHYRFFEYLETKYDDVALYLMNLFSATDIHANAGLVNIADKIKEYRVAEIKFRSKTQRLQLDRNFVGREKLLKDCIQCLKGDEEQSKMGLVLCGLSGMGKTSLAGAICSKLQTDQPSWEIVKVNQRGKSEIAALCMDLVDSLCEGRDSDQLPQLLQQDLQPNKLLEYVMELLEQRCHGNPGRGILLWLDDLDGHCSSKTDELCKFLKDVIKMLASIQTGSKTRLLLTVARKLGREHEPVRWINQRLGDRLIEIEVPAMTPAETELILKKFSSLQEKDITFPVCQKLCALCCGSPIAIRSVADMLREGCSLQDVMGYLKCDTGLDLVMNEQLNKCITKAIERIDIDIGSKECQELLVQVSVFQTAEFDINDAYSVLYGSRKEKDYIEDVNKSKLKVRLIEFKARHLLEISSQYHTSHKESQVYSLHPLVAKYLTMLMNESKDLKIAEELAKSKFLHYFYDKILEFATNQDKNPVRTKFKIENKRVHIKHFFELFLYDDYCKTMSLFDFTSPKLSRKSLTVQHNRLWKIAQSFLHLEQRRLFAQAQARYAYDRQNVCGYMYWTCMEIENLIHQDKKELAEKVMDTMLGKIGVQTSSDRTQEAGFNFRVNDWDWPPVEVVPVYATYCVIRGRLILDKTPPDMALQYLKLAEEMYTGKIPTDIQSRASQERISKRDFRNERAKVQNLIGVVHFNKGEYECARDYHDKAFNTIRKELQDNVKWHEDFTEYQSNLASTYHQEGLNTSDKSVRRQKFEEALKIYSRCIETDKTMKRDKEYAHACVLGKRADIYYLQDEVKRAITDQKQVVRIMDNIFRPPNINVTLAYEQISRYYFKQGKLQKSHHQSVESSNSLEQALDYFGDTLSHIVIGGLPIEHNNQRTYRIIKEKHLQCLKMLGKRQEKVEKKYQRFEEGYYNKSIHQNKMDDFDREEFLKKAQEEGTVFELIPCSDNSDSDDSSGSSTGSSKTTASSSSDSREGIPRARQDSVIKAASIEETDPVHNMLANEVFKVPSRQASKVDSDTKCESSDVELRLKSDGEDCRPPKRDSGLGVSGEYSMESEDGRGRQLVRQSSVDMPQYDRDSSRIDGRSADFCNTPSTSKHPSDVSPIVTHTSDMRSLKRSSDMSVDEDLLNSSLSAEQRRNAWLHTPTGSQSSVEERRESWASTGSQDSVTSQLKRFRPFAETECIEGEEMPRKKLRKSEAIEEEHE